MATLRNESALLRSNYLCKYYDTPTCMRRDVMYGKQGHDLIGLSLNRSPLFRYSHCEA